MAKFVFKYFVNSKVKSSGDPKFSGLIFSAFFFFVLVLGQPYYFLFQRQFRPFLARIVLFSFSFTKKLLQPLHPDKIG